MPAPALPARLPLGHLVAVDKVVRLYRSIEARRRAIEFNLLFQRPTRLPLSVAVAARRDLARLEKYHRFLVNNSFVRNARYLRVLRAFNRYGRANDHLDDLFGDYRVRTGKQEDPLTVAVLARAREAAVEARRAELGARLIWAMSERHDEGWYAVFDTLTVRPGMEDAVFAPRSTYFQQYIKRWRHAVATSAYGSVRKTPQGVDFYEYFAVVERGDKTGRLHIHVVHLCRALPAAAADPNLGRPYPTERVMCGLKKFWQAGWSMPIAVRYGPSDAYGMLGWRWPMSAKPAGLEPAPLGHPERLAGYLAGYIGKAANLRGNFSWRTRMTRRLGCRRLTAAMLTMKTVHLLDLTHRPLSRKYHHLHGQILPPNLLRREATRHLMTRWRALRPRQRLKFLPTLQPAETCVERLRSLTRKRPAPNLQNIGRTATRTMSATAASELLARLRAYAPAAPRVVAAGGSLRSYCH